MVDSLTFTQIQNDISGNDVVLYMKGTADAPLCGFSSFVAQLLKHLQVPFKAINVLEDPNIREGIKKFSNWPTIPQLYIKGEFIGGCDIVKEMHQNGELQDFFANKGIKTS